MSEKLSVAATPAAQTSSDNIIELCDVNFSYEEGGAPAVKGVNLTVKRGEFLSVIGHNGSGKSTLARLVCGLLEADGGTIRVFGMEATDDSFRKEIRRRVGMVFQNPDNQMVASVVEDDIAFGPENIGLSRKETGERIEWALAAVGMSDFRHSSPERLSGGQKQRIAVAGVLAIKPDVLILDESTAMLDPKGRREVMEVASRLNREEGMTVIIVTHFMEEALAADRTIVMNRGEIVLSGTPEEIFENGELLETFNLSLPEITLIASSLRAAGMNVADVLRPEELADEISADFAARGIYGARSSDAAEKTRDCPHEWDVDVKRLSYVYSKKSPFATRALKDVNLHIDDGEFFGIIGHTGSGKSTLIQHLNALIRLPQADKHFKKPKAKKGKPAPQLPSITIGKFDLSDKKTDFKALRASVGMVFQYPEYQLFAETVTADVAFGLKNFNKNLPKEEVEKAVRESIAMVGLDYDEVKDKSPFELSGGQKRRAAIAGVIVTKPEILVLDEPAAGLDPAGKKAVMEMLHRLHREWCRTIIIVSHDMDEVASNCTRAAILSDGSVWACDRPAALFSKSDEIAALGLDVPLTVKLEKLLESRNIYVHSDCTVDDFCRKCVEAAGIAEGGGEDA